MPQHIAIFGAGPALGLSTARRFAAEGHAVTLVGRTPETLDALVAELAGAGVAVERELADLADPEQVRRAALALVARSGVPDVVVYSPGDVRRLPVAVADLDAATLASWLPLHLLSPVELAHVLVPGMAERGSGAFLVAQGVSVRVVLPALASVSAAQAGLLNFLHSLAAEVGPRGVHVASLQIGQLIERSAAARLVDSGHFDRVDVGPIARIHPDELAERLWELATSSAAVELVS